MISREEAIERLERMLDETQVVCNSYTATELIRSALKKDEETYRMAIEALSQPERPKGRYIPDNRYQTLGNCSLCNGDVTMHDNFCPNCGADMREVEK